MEFDTSHEINDIVWRGTYTSGYCWGRGTAISLHPPAVVLTTYSYLNPLKQTMRAEDVRYESPQSFKDAFARLYPVNAIEFLAEQGTTYDLSKLEGMVGNEDDWNVVLAPPDVWPKIYAELDEVTAFAAKENIELRWI